MKSPSVAMLTTGARGKHLDYGARVIRVGNTAPRYVMGIELARDVDVAVGVEPCGEFVALIPEERLGGEDGWYLGGSVPARGFAFRGPSLWSATTPFAWGESLGVAGGERVPFLLIWSS